MQPYIGKSFGAAQREETADKQQSSLHIEVYIQNSSKPFANNHISLKELIIMTLIQFNKIGKIIAGDEMGGFIKIIHNIEDTGGYYILFSENIDFVCVYDSWVENQENLNKYFEESQWTIKWID